MCITSFPLLFAIQLINNAKAVLSAHVTLRFSSLGRGDFLFLRYIAAPQNCKSSMTMAFVLIWCLKMKD